MARPAGWGLILFVGVAVFGAIFNNRLAASLPKYLPPSALRAVHGSNISASPAQLDALPPAIHHGYVLAFSDSLHAVFLIGAPIALLAFALTWFLKDLPLRGHAYLAADDALPHGNAPDTPPGRRQVVSHAGNWRRYLSGACGIPGRR